MTKCQSTIHIFSYSIWLKSENCTCYLQHLLVSDGQVPLSHRPQATFSWASSWTLLHLCSWFRSYRKKRKQKTIMITCKNKDVWEQPITSTLTLLVLCCHLPSFPLEILKRKSSRHISCEIRSKQCQSLQSGNTHQWKNPITHVCY